MLYKNDEQYKLAPNDLKALLDRFKKFPLVITYPPERIVKSRSVQNKNPDKPNSISFPLTATVKSKNGADHWRYAENIIIKEHGVRKYTPKNLRFNGSMTLQETDSELAWFLFTKSSYCKGGTNAGRKYKFEFEDKITAAELKAEIESVRTHVKALIYSTELGLSEDRLRALAKAMFIRNVDDLTLAQTKLAIEHYINRTADGHEKFIEMTHMDDLIKTRMMMQTLMDANKLKYEVSKKEWQWIEDGKRIQGICKVAPGGNANDALYDYYMGNKNFQEEVEAVIMSKKIKV
jgi:hypothetical protein